MKWQIRLIIAAVIAALVFAAVDLSYPMPGWARVTAAVACVGAVIAAALGLVVLYRHGDR